GTTPEREAGYLFLHSLLHLFGYDHMKDDEKAEMREKEEEILKTIGLSR
ncbi:MAG: rRNA maturation RNase YbeY, partial [Clostridiales bacterium]|nr:rRNA maturation RNase YbeY [Clostridiales bacterium]MDY5530506.1 rRNA maturation RNase YbeY [Eubacteriales bacterium]